MQKSRIKIAVRRPLHLVFLIPLLLGGCAAAAAVSAVPGVLMDRAVGFFSGQEASLPVSMQRALVGVQQGLARMDLQADVLEPVEDGYIVEFGDGQLDGDVELKRQTGSLTTLTILARRGLSRQASVEQALLKEVRQAAEKAGARENFNFDGYGKVYTKPDSSGKMIGWFRPGSMLHVSESKRAGWLKIKMPSGQHGYFKGKLRDDAAS